MAIRTIADSVSKVSAPPADVAALDARIAELRARFPGAIFERYLDKVPTVGERVYVAPGAAIVGDVTLHDDVSIWFGCVLRGDVNRIIVGARSNLQDGTVVHLGDDDPTIVGEDVVVGHRAVLHACVIEDGCLVGIQATVLDGVRMGHGSIVGSGAVVTAGQVIPPRSLVLGMPAKVVKTVGEEMEDFHRRLAGKYVRLAHNHRVG